MNASSRNAWGAVSRPSIVTTRCCPARYTTMKPPPPMPATYGSVTPRVALAAIAASTALPPRRRIPIAVRVASWSTVAAAPPVPVATACFAACGCDFAEAKWSLPAGSPGLPDQQVHADDVVDRGERPRLPAGPVDRERPSFETASHEDRHDSAGLGAVLARADDVVVAQHGVVEIEKLPDHAAVGLAGELADPVQRHGIQRSLLLVPGRGLAVDRARRSVDEAPDSPPCGAQEETKRSERVHGQ